MLLNNRSEILQAVTKLNNEYEAQVWDKDTALRYLEALVEKHGIKIHQELELADKHCTNLYFGALASKDRNSKLKEERKWHIGEITLVKFDKPIFDSMLKKLKDSWPTFTYLLDKWEFLDLGLFFLSVRDSNIFEN